MELSTLKAVVTGGGSGMGRVFTIQLAKAGAQVVFCDLNDDGIRETEEQAKDLPGKVKGVKANVAKEDDVVNLIDTASKEMGGLNCLINNAGIFRDGLLVKKDKNTGEVKKMSLEKWQSVIDVDLTGPFLCTREFATRVIESGTESAVVVNMSSISRYGNAGQSNYSAAKAGLVADTRLWAKELAKFGIRVGAVAPGLVETPILQGMPPAELEKMAQRNLVGRVGKPEELFQAVQFIIECDYFTGRAIDVDGGSDLGEA